MADRDSEIKKLLAQDPDYASDTDITKRAKREDKMPNRTAPSAEADYMGKRSVHDTLKSLTPREARMVQLVHGIRGGGGGGGGGGMGMDNPILRNRKMYKEGGKVKSASARADGCCIRGKTRA